MQLLSVREANQNFSKLISDVEKGDIIIITKHGKRVAELRPVIEDRMQDPVWRANYERMVEMLNNKPSTGGPVGEITEEDKYGDAPL
ncbi:MAG TPA: type II toxin-antitoxin system prevent-host-death family antitoxin [Geminicoccaceae bacterium]|nr:type II toxin-antitoxin system prevent-host-death family antitoxin [Geminicoccus sp.]HMU50054.1 type II toxin-antitoxin system prevent-host-death family antitoxin [Geminicoccaceae bacterium]